MKKRVNEFLDLVADAKDRLPALAKELDANDCRITWSIESEHGEEIDFTCRINLDFGRFNNYHAGSYINFSHDFEEAAAEIRNMHDKWLRDEAKWQQKQDEEALKQRLLEEYLRQNQPA